MSDARIFLHANGDIAIQWYDDQIYVIPDGTLDLVEEDMLDERWTELVRQCPFVARPSGRCQLVEHGPDTQHYTRMEP